MKHALTFCVISLLLVFEVTAAEQCPAPPPDDDNKICRPTKKEIQAFQPKGGLAWILDSAEFKALAEATFATAGDRLKKIVGERKPDAMPWVVAIDADDTILDNMQFQVEGEACGVGYSIPRWREWVRRQEAGAVPGAAGFLARVAVLGGKIAIVTNRDADQMKETAKNMRMLGLSTDSEQVCFLGKPACPEKPDHGNNKDPRYTALRAGTAELCWKDKGDVAANSWARPHEIVMYIGDNVQDFPGITQATAAARAEIVAEHLGHDWFLIPNAAYGSWEKTRGESWIRPVRRYPAAGWANLSGLAADPKDPNILYAVADKAANPAKIVIIDLSEETPRAIDTISLAKGDCGDIDLENLDLEGIAAIGNGSFCIVSEGENREGEKKRENLLLKVENDGTCKSRIALPEELKKRFISRGFEGVTVDEDGKVYIAIQSPLKDKDDPAKNEDETIIARFDPAAVNDDEAWKDYRYKLEEPKGDAEVGINELLYLGGKSFAVIERDDQESCKAKIKRIHTFTLPPDDGPNQLVKDEGIDLIKFFNRAGVLVAEQIEGLAITPDDKVFVVTDADKDEDTLLLYLGTAKATGLKP
ncbi:MAG: esterase-like activity of phytase family protein [Methyloceanibacter sp.]|uniref:esterase-like activity of phytase family protein n=1 Tax=Methyloceanibacter sp. TaxID=1965321 RepID=UPI003D6CB99F